MIDSLIISNAGAPTTSTVGTIGQLYEDTTNGELYQCTNVSGSTYTWTKVDGTTLYESRVTGTGSKVASLSIAGKGTSAYPYAFPVLTSGSGDAYWSYIRTSDLTSSLSEAYVGAYEYDGVEDWRAHREARLALYSDLDGRIITGAGAPTTSTIGTVGQVYEDTTNGKLYICTDATNPYTWAEVSGGGYSPTIQNNTLYL